MLYIGLLVPSNFKFVKKNMSSRTRIVNRFV